VLLTFLQDTSLPDMFFLYPFKFVFLFTDVDSFEKFLSMRHAGLRVRCGSGTLMAEARPLYGYCNVGAVFAPCKDLFCQPSVVDLQEENKLYSLAVVRCQTWVICLTTSRVIGEP
jgi:hypothetical protein